MIALLMGWASLVLGDITVDEEMRLLRDIVAYENSMRSAGDARVSVEDITNAAGQAQNAVNMGTEAFEAIKNAILRGANEKWTTQEGRECHDICTKDDCTGTLSNPIPWSLFGGGKKWDKVASEEPEASAKGCCYMGEGMCDICCVPRSARVVENSMLSAGEARVSVEDITNAAGQAQDIANAGKDAFEAIKNAILRGANEKWTTQEGRECHDVCTKDGCTGTVSNPIPWTLFGGGDKWDMVAKEEPEASAKGCCYMGEGMCDICCVPRPARIVDPVSVVTGAVTAVQTGTAAFEAIKDAILRGANEKFSLQEGRECQDICTKDDCSGTMSNPIPWTLFGGGDKWDKVASEEPEASAKGCCFGGKGMCDVCCVPK